MNILEVITSPRGNDSVSTQIAQQIVEKLKVRYGAAHVEVLNLGQQAHPILDGAALGALFTPAESRTDAQHARVAQDDYLIAQVQAADVIVLGVPMYNFGIPVQLKSWFDAIARAGVTFRYTDTGPRGLLTGKKVYLALARGGRYRDTPNELQVPYLKTMLGFLGMTDLSFVFAEGLAMGPEAAAKGMAEAKAQTEALFS